MSYYPQHSHNCPGCQGTGVQTQKALNPDAVWHTACTTKGHTVAEQKHGREMKEQQNQSER